LEGYMESRGIPTRLEYPENGTRHMKSSHHRIQVACRDPGAQRLCVTWCRAFRRGVSETHDKIDPSQTEGREPPLLSEPQRYPNRGSALNPRGTKGRAQEGYVDSPKNVRCWMQVRVIRRMSPGQSRPQVGCGVSQNHGPTKISGETQSSHGTKCRPQSDHAERSDLAKRFFIAGWERGRAERE
jgi:hypothetical protein